MNKLNWWQTACFAFLLCLTTAIVLPAQDSTPIFTTLHTFGAEGSNPKAALVQGADGKLYGTTLGGANNKGTVFAITLSGTLTTLYNFCSQSGCADGADPFTALVEVTDGNFYGTTSDAEVDGGGVYGTVFKITPSGTLTTLHTFDFTDGAFPFAGLVQAANGNFYGTTDEGGANSIGTVFEITPGGTLTTLHSFAGYPTEGSIPVAGLVQAGNGDLYGTTSNGGSIGLGSAFKITPSGTLTTLHSFCSQTNCADGNDPNAALVQGTDGNFYGTTVYGGANGAGAVFQITPSGTLTTLHSFDGADGANPVAGLVQATDGNFYGTTLDIGANGYGTVFEITPSGTLTTLHTFDLTDGAYPATGLIQDTNGKFYGTTPGTIFSLAVGLAPFVETQRTFGKVGAAVKILGTNLTGATSVSFNGTAATFSVVSPSLITTTVPAGATTGKVKVTIPGGTLSSNVLFRVLP